MDFLFYYPAQIIPDGGYCGGDERCGGSFQGITELEDETDFNRTFGIVDSCAGTLDEDEEVGRCALQLQRTYLNSLETRWTRISGVFSIDCRTVLRHRISFGLAWFGLATCRSD